MILSILIPSIVNRSENLRHLLRILFPQMGNYSDINYTYSNYAIVKIYNDEVEILVDIDNKQVTTGEKRNRLVNAAKGDYVVMIDDDDAIPDYYIEKMLNACHSGSDCVAINGNMTTDGTKEIKWRISKDYDNVTIKENGVDLYLRKTNHITAVKREIALKCPFPDKSNAEDKAYSDAINKYLKTEFTINEPMYTYRYSTKNKEY